jgi:hypothetical protein
MGGYLPALPVIYVGAEGWDSALLTSILILLNEYECDYACCRIQMRSKCYLNIDVDRIFSQLRTDTKTRLVSYIKST